MNNQSFLHRLHDAIKDEKEIFVQMSGRFMKVEVLEASYDAAEIRIPDSRFDESQKQMAGIFTVPLSILVIKMEK